MHGLNLIGWMLLTLGAMSFALPLFPSQSGQRSNYSVGLVMMCLAAPAIPGTGTQSCCPS